MPRRVAEGAQNSSGRRHTLRGCFAAAVARLRSLSDTPELDARLLAMHAFGLTHEQLAARGAGLADPAAVARLDELVERRLRGEPVSRILGAREFYGRDFLIDRSTLDPRPDTETVVEACLDVIGAKGLSRPKLLDLGTGSGCILLTLLAELPYATGIGVDRSFHALRLARKNARRLSVSGRASFLCGDWLDAVSARFDVIVANPPYIPTEEIKSLAPEVKDHDPLGALDGGADGLAAYRIIIGGVVRALAPEGFLVLEIGQGQAEPVRFLLQSAGLHAGAPASGDRDLGGVMRCLRAVRCDKKSLGTVELKG